jgi:hypothetical protein
MKKKTLNFKDKNTVEKQNEHKRTSKLKKKCTKHEKKKKSKTKQQKSQIVFIFA